MRLTNLTNYPYFVNIFCKFIRTKLICIIDSNAKGKKFLEDEHKNFIKIKGLKLTN